MTCLETQWLAVHVSVHVTRAVEALVVLRYTGHDTCIVVRVHDDELRTIYGSRGDL